MSQLQHSFFSLPPEIRLCIYRHALIPCKREGGLRSRTMVQDQIMIPVLRDPADRMVPTLLRTCKQIYREALPILYSENEFMIDPAKKALDWLQQIGPINITLLKSLRLFPHAVYSETGKSWLGDDDPDYSGPTWCKLLNKLANEATALENVYVYLDADEELSHYGAGKDLNFVRALGRMKVSRRMKIDGYFAREWPRYLEGKLGMPVWDTEGHSQDFLLWLREYQRGTESLIP